MKSVRDVEEELLLKEMRILYWERFRTLPTAEELSPESLISKEVEA